MVSFRSHLAKVNRPSGTLSSMGKEGWVEGAPFMGRAFSSLFWRRRIPVLLFRGLPVVLFLGALCATVSARAAQMNPLLQSWLNAQTNIHTWSADVTQTRALKTLTQPLVAQGHVWFAAPNRFRWQIGNASDTGGNTNTIALRQADQLLVIYPRLKVVEKYPLNSDQNGPWKDTLALLEAGFPQSQSDLEKRFKILSVTQTNGACEVTLQPRSASARRMMPQLTIAFATGNFSLRATELQFADGSTMRNEFNHATLNPKIEESLFTPKFDAEYRVVEPLKK